MSSELLPKTPSGSSSLAQWLQSLTSFVRSSRIIESPDVKPTITSQGTALRIKTRAGTGGATGTPSWRGEWQYWEDAANLEPGEGPRPRRYAEGDMVIRGGEQVIDDAGHPLLIDGSTSGTWIARRELTLGEAPGVPTAEETAANVFDWDLVARFANPTFVTKRGTKRITLGATPADVSVYMSDSGSSTLADTVPGSINISLTAAQGKNITLREINVCQNNVMRKMIILASEIYD
jgi:hypothetical protein